MRWIIMQLAYNPQNNIQQETSLIHQDKEIKWWYS